MEMTEETYHSLYGSRSLIVFEGISGCGKSENIKSLHSHLTDIGYKTYVIEWNSNRIIRSIISRMSSIKILTPNIYSFFQWISFLIDYVFKVTPLLKKNYVVLADRYVYTGLTRDVANGARGSFGRYIYKKVAKPDLVFFQDIRPCVCYERIKKRGKVLFHTNKKILNSSFLKNKELYYLAKLRKEYLALFSNKNVSNETKIIKINANNELIKKYVEDFISKKRETYEYVKTYYQ